MNKYPNNPILFVDDEEQFLFSIELTMTSGRINNFITCSESTKVKEILASQNISLLVLDLNMPGISGIELLKYVSQNYPNIPVIIITAVNEVSEAVECMKLGAVDYLVKPVDDARLITTVKRGLKLQEMFNENEKLKDSLLNSKLKNPEVFSSIITKSEKMHSIFKYIEAIAATHLPVLVRGETGVGKEAIAKIIHQLSGREGELVTLNVAGIDDSMFSDTLFGHKKGAFTGADSDRKGLIERAAKGTIFLDEIGDLSMESQVKLLRLLQEGTYYPLGSDKEVYTDARIIVATHRNLEEMQKEEQFRRDLYYRLKAHEIKLPPLRERKEDINVLLNYFVDKASKELNKKKPLIPKELFTLLKNYNFPGNVRELEGLVYDAVSRNNSPFLSLNLFKERIDFSELPEEENKITSFEEGAVQMIFGDLFPTLKDMEQMMIEEALRRAEGNQGIAAELLGISRRALNNRLMRAKKSSDDK